MRGDKEQKCLDLIKKQIFTNDGVPIHHPFTKKTYTEVNDSEFINDQMFFINSQCSVSYFGLLKEDRDEIEQILRIAKPNNKISEFPDFKFDSGFIEHFQVSSSKTTRKGAEHIKQSNQFETKVNAEVEILKQEWNKTPSFDAVRTKQREMDNPEHSHSFLISSFQDSWNNHINSLNKYQGRKDIGIFLIEYSDCALNMIENVYKSWINGMSQGDMREQEKFNCYRLTRDKVLLEFIYQHKNKIKYVVFKYGNGFEIIRLENIPYLLKLMPWEYIIRPMVVKNISLLKNISTLTNLG